MRMEVDVSRAAIRTTRRGRKTCTSCLARQARYSYRGTVRADRDHTLCFECFRAERERQRARALADAVLRAPLPYLVPGAGRPAVRPAGGDPVPDRRSDVGGIRPRPLTMRQVAHRRVMLDFLVRQRAGR
jgi:hypothetical protein